LVAVGYSSAVIAGIRRIVYPSGRAICLRGLLGEFKSRLHLLTREAANERGANHRFAFDEHFPEQDAITRGQIDGDFAQLDKMCRSLKDHVDQRLAHLDRQPTGPVPTFGDLSSGLGTIEATILRYGAIIDGRPF